MHEFCNQQIPFCVLFFIKWGTFRIYSIPRDYRGVDLNYSIPRNYRGVDLTYSIPRDYRGVDLNYSIPRDYRGVDLKQTYPWTPICQGKTMRRCEDKCPLFSHQNKLKTSNLHF